MSPSYTMLCYSHCCSTRYAHKGKLCLRNIDTKIIWTSSMIYIDEIKYTNLENRKNSFKYTSIVFKQIYYAFEK